MRYHNKGLAALLCILLIGASTSPAQQVRKRPVPPPKNARPASDPFLDPGSGPITLAKLLELLQRVREDIETEGRISRGVEARGIDFPMTPANTQTVAAAGASAKLKELLERKAPQPPPPAVSQTPPPKVEEPPGVLSVQCEPAECEITVRGGPPSLSTNKGTARIPGLKPGEALVTILKPGFLDRHLTAAIRSGTTASLHVILEPDANTQAEFGTRLFKAMVQAIGGEARKDLLKFTTAGSATLFDNAGKGTEWNLTVSFRPGQATLEARNSAGGLKLECRGETCQAQSGARPFAKRLSSEQAQIVETSLRQFRMYHFAAILDRLISAGMQATAKTANVPGSGEQRLRLEGKTEAYNISLDAQLFPTFITFESKTGLGSGLTLGFGDFVVVGASHYPRTTEIKFSDGKQGLRVRFGDIVVLDR